MIVQESEWYRDTIRNRVKTGSLVLNIGSSTKHFVEVQQPYIKKNVLDELAKKNCTVKNVDIKTADGVDLVGDISNPAFVEEMRTLKPDVVICGSVLEQVWDRRAFSKGLESLVDGSTILIVSVPHRYPYHEDPIDTLYRPTLKELTKEFPSLRLLEGKVVAGDWYFSLMARKFGSVGKVWYFIKRVIKFVVLVLTLQWKKATDVGWAFRKISATCAVYTHRSNI